MAGVIRPAAYTWNQPQNWPKPLHPHIPQQSPASKLARESSTFQAWKQEALWFFFWLPVGGSHLVFPFGDCFYTGPACDVPSWRHKQVKVNNEGKTGFQTKGLFTRCVPWVWWLAVFKANDSTSSNRRDRGKGKGAKQGVLTSSVGMASNRNPWYGECLGKLRWGLKGFRQVSWWTWLLLAGFRTLPQLHPRLRKVTGPWYNAETEDPAGNLWFNNPQFTARQA